MGFGEQMRQPNELLEAGLPQGHLLPDDLLQEEASTQEDPRGHLLLMATSYGVLEQGVGRRT